MGPGTSSCSVKKAFIFIAIVIICTYIPSLILFITAPYVVMSEKHTRHEVSIEVEPVISTYYSPIRAVLALTGHHDCAVYVRLINVDSSKVTRKILTPSEDGEFQAKFTKIEWKNDAVSVISYRDEKVIIPFSSVL